MYCILLLYFLLPLCGEIKITKITRIFAGMSAFSGESAKVLARKSVSVSASWNAGFMLQSYSVQHAQRSTITLSRETKLRKKVAR